MIRPWLIALAILALASNAAAQNVLNVPQGASLTAGGSAGQVQYYGTGGALAGFTMGGDCTAVVATGAVTCTTLNGVAPGTFYSANAATPPAIGGTTPAAGAFTTLSATGAVSGAGVTSLFASPPAIGGTAAAAGTFNALTDTGITGSTQCVHVNSSGALSGVGADCGAPLPPGGSANAIQFNSGSTTFSGSAATANTAGLLTGESLDFLSTTLACTASTSGLHLTAAGRIDVCIAGTSIGYFNAAGINSIATGAFTSVTATTVLAASFLNSSTGHRLFNNAAPTVTGFCTGPAVSAQNGSGAFLISVGTGCSGNTTGTITMPAAATGWACHGTDFTTHGSFVIDMFSTSTTLVTVNVYAQTTGLATTITSSDKIEASCTGY